VAGFRERYESKRLLLRDFDVLARERTLLPKMADVPLDSVPISVVGVLRKVGYRDDAEFADFFQGVQFGIAEQIGAISDVVGALRIAAFGVLVGMFARLGGWSTVGHRGGGLPRISCIRTCWSAPWCGAPRRSLAGVLRIVGKGVARHYFISSSLTGTGMSTWPTLNCLSRCESLRPVFFRKKRRPRARARPNRFTESTAKKIRMMSP